MVNYAVDPAALHNFLPGKTDLDTWNGIHYVSLVGFLFLETKVLGMKIPFHINFEEVNLRFYVKRKFNNEWRRGVVFIKEIVPRAAIAFVANNFYNEKYQSMPMKHFISRQEFLQVEYQWKFKQHWNFMKVKTAGPSQKIVPGSEEEFITEHYWGYNKINATITTEYKVEHEKWKVYSVNDYSVNCDFGKLYGDEFSFLGGATPVSVFIADGAEVKVRTGIKI